MGKLIRIWNRRIITRPVIFSSVEELADAARTLGWEFDYLQMRKGVFSAKCAVLASEGTYLASNQINHHLHIEAEPPAGSIALCVPRQTAGLAKMCGRNLTTGEMIVLPSRSRLEVVTRGEIRYDALILEQARFAAAARGLVPTKDLTPGPGSAAIIQGRPMQLGNLRRQFDLVFGRAEMDQETAEGLLTETIMWMADSSTTLSTKCLGNGVSATTARRAQTFIENHYRDTIRMEELCRFVGVGLRTLQRCFATQFQISPHAYIKVRRLNAARKSLIAANPAEFSVTQIALNNGCHHLGRFSVEYRRHFGESPSQTLSRLCRVRPRTRPVSQ